MNNSDDFDLNVNNYSKNELLSLCDIPGDSSDISIIKATNTRILQYNDNPPIKEFFQNMNKLLEDMIGEMMKDPRYNGSGGKTRKSKTRRRGKTRRSKTRRRGKRRKTRTS